MRKTLLTATVCILSLLQTQAQKIDLRSDSIDILHYSIHATVRNLQGKYIHGKTLVQFKSVMNGLNKVRFDLLGLQVNNITQNGNNLTFTRTAESILINLSNTLAKDDTTEISISYSGQPQVDPKWGGFFFNGNYAFNMGVGMGSSPHNFGRCWFPCIDNFTERSTYSFTITTDSGYAAVCSGLLMSQQVAGDSAVWSWQLNQTIPTYLASVAVGKYVFVKYNFQGAQSTYPVWLATVAADTTKIKNSFTRLNNALQCFESKFGPYLFDRVGYVAVPFNSGAMEHAANIAYPIYAIDGTSNYETLMAHELAHAWWGNLVTCKTASDMWLNEGWASYCEALFMECAYGKTAYHEIIYEKLADVQLNAARNDKGFRPVSGVDSTNTYGTHVYRKGALVVHNLRSYMGDSAFFAACKHYLNQLRFSHATSDNLKSIFQPFTPQDLNAFFDNWVYAPGQIDIGLVAPPIFSQGNNKTTIQIELAKQSRMKGNSFSNMPIPITFKIYSGNYSTSFNLLSNSHYTKHLLQLDTLLDIANTYFTINETDTTALARTMTHRMIATSGTVSFPNELVSINVQTINGNKPLVIEHHWTEGFQNDELRKMGIRLSPERHWRIDGGKNFQTDMKAFAFFNYDGRNEQFLDQALLKNTTHEDSIVLLYKPFDSNVWTIHTDHTFQPGNNANDKMGRFWVNNLQKGYYAFGIRDGSVVGLQEKGKSNMERFKVYPNPTEKYFTILSINEKPAEAEVYDMNGKLMQSISIHAKATKVNTETWQKGTYLIKVKGEDIQTIKLLVQ